MVKKHIGISLILTALVAVLLLVSACGSTSTTTGTNTNTSSQTPLQVLQNTRTAMKQLKSVHLDLKFNGAIQVSGTPTTTTGTSATPQNLSFNMMGSGDEAPPNQSSFHLSIAQSASGQGLNLSEILLGNKVYIQNSKGQWYVLDKSKLLGSSNNPFSGTDVSNVDNLLNLAQTAKLTDHGTENLNGQNLRHLTFSFDQQSLSQLLSSGQLGSILGQQNVAQILNNIKLSKATLDVWIDESTSYVHRAELKMNLDVNLSALHNSATPTANPTALPNITTDIDTVIDLSKFNAPVTITAPANAIPTNEPSTIFG